MEERRLLLVEGQNDMHVILAIQGRRGVRFLTKEQIFVCEDSGRLLSGFPVRLTESDISRLGVVMDADENLSSRWIDLRKILLNAGYAPVPSEPEKDGTIIEPPADTILPRVGIWLMPDNSSSGILEDFLRFLVPTDCNVLAHAQKAVRELPEIRFSRVAEPKAVIHTWLAWQKSPGLPLGMSITAKFLNSEVHKVDVFVEWLRRLFDTPR